MADAGQGSVMEWMLTADLQTAASAVATATAVMWWPDQASGSAALICKCGRWRLRPSLSYLRCCCANVASIWGTSLDRHCGCRHHDQVGRT